MTTNIQDDGKRINIHNIGKTHSEKARKEIEIQEVNIRNVVDDSIERLLYMEGSNEVHGRSVLCVAAGRLLRGKELR